jgi:photosystem II stability/assembly factor-like uncharacterized protein
MNKVKFTLFFVFILACVRIYGQPYGWFSQTSGTSNNLNAVYFVNPATGVVVAQSGMILRTTNGGTNWGSVPSGTGAHLFGVYFVTGSTGYAVGDVGVVLKTTNAGSSWSLQSSGVGYQLRSVSFINTNTGYIAGWYGTFLRTTNAGATWVSYATGLSSNLNCVSFADANNGFAGGQFGNLIRTTNGGINWSTISSGTSSQIEQVSFTGTTEASIIGEGGIIRKTTNLGTNWIAQTSGTGNWLNGLTVKNQTFMVVVGDYGTIRKTSNGGLNWYQQTSNTGNPLSAVSFADTNTGWAVGINGTIMKTTTGGWLLPGAASLNLPANGQTCFAMTGTLDWSDVFPPVCNYRLQIASDQNFTSIVHEVAGLNVSQYILPVSVLNYNTLYYWRVKATNFVGESTSWSSVRNFRTINQNVLTPGLISPADNSAVNSTPQLNWDSVAFASTYRCRIATDTGFTNVVLDSSNIPGKLINVPAGRLLANTRYYWRVNASNTCITSGYSPRWSFTTSITGLVQSGTGLPKVYELYNNYPNPFNPSTQINFDLPKSSAVKITVFNVIGEVAAVLVNSDLAGGKYSYTWNAVDYASGLYIYRIEAVSSGNDGEKFISTKKMMLIK